MTRINITTIAMTRRMCINPPMVYAETKPSTQRIIKIIAIVSSIFYTPKIRDLKIRNLKDKKPD